MSEQVEVIRVMCSLHMGQQTTRIQHHQNYSFVIHQSFKKEATLGCVCGTLSVGKSKREGTLVLNEGWMEFRLFYPDSSRTVRIWRTRFRLSMCASVQLCGCINEAATMSTVRRRRWQPFGKWNIDFCLAQTTTATGERTRPLAIVLSQEQR